MNPLDENRKARKARISPGDLSAMLYGPSDEIIEESVQAESATKNRRRPRSAPAAFAPVVLFDRSHPSANDGAESSLSSTSPPPDPDREERLLWARL